ncbi:MAG: NAD-glutamate dehydrogenase domain-containing protein, partial [Pseudomonadota bacterium]
MTISAKEAFLEQFKREAEGEDLSGFQFSDLTELADDLWSWSETLPPDRRDARVRLVAPKLGSAPPHTVLEAAGPDAPFLVDSLLNECAGEGHEVRALLHPVANCAEGGHRSVIQIHLPILTAQEQAVLTDGARKTLADIDAAVADYDAMRTRMQQEARRVANLQNIEPGLRREATEFLEWLIHEHFLFLGSRAYVFERGPDGHFSVEEPEMIEGSNLGILRDESRNILNRGAEPTVITEKIGAFLEAPTPLIIAKSTMMSRVHRRVKADYIGIKVYDDAGRVQGEVRFAGLFTAEAYTESVHSIPLLRRRVEKVMEESGRLGSRHSQKALDNILETWPRDELFQTDAKTLAPMAIGALHLIGHNRTRLFLRYDQFGRYASAILYVVRENYSSELRQRIAEYLEGALGGTLEDFQPRFDGGPLARVNFIFELPPGAPRPDISVLEAEVSQLARRWDDAFREALLASDLSEVERDGAGVFKGAFNGAYREAFSAEEALLDLREIAALNAGSPFRMRVYRRDDDPSTVLRAKLYARGDAVRLSNSVPIFENMGLFMDFETGYPVTPSAPPMPGAPSVYWIHDAALRSENGQPVDLTRTAKLLENGFTSVWSGAAEDDGFNQLILAAGATCREAGLLRALAAYRRQSGLDPARPTQIEALVSHPEIATALLTYFKIRFDPDFQGDMATRRGAAEVVRADINTALDAVPSLDHDRILRRLADLIGAIQRTSYFQTTPDGAPRTALAFKISSGELDDLPQPKPYREVFVSSPEVDGVHLRFGPVSRGGLRWSDRRDDFRTEVLGLVKAQQVKNAVIVPTGSKGGFFPKQIPIGAGRDEVREAGTAAYKMFIASLLSVTDNIVQGDLR